MRHLFRKNYNKSYAQCGEDLIVAFALEAMGISRPVYLDIGAHEPVFLNNTYLFYKRGSRGVCVEPDPLVCRKLRKKRPGDIVLNMGVGATREEEKDFYVLSEKTLSTFSKDEAERFSNYGNKSIEKTIRLPMLPINTILERYFKSCPNFISLDTEGFDLEIIKTLDWGSYQPDIFCVETLSYTEDKSERKLSDIIDYMKEKSYLVYADTYINSIFVRRESWKKRR